MTDATKHVSWLQKKTLLATAGAVAIIASAFYATSGSPRTVVQSGIPVPFVASGGSFAGNVASLGKRNGIDVYELTFRNGEDFETMLVDKIYIVHVPRGTGMPVPLDTVITGPSGTERDLNFYGYRYSDDNASSEKRDINAVRFKDRFPGQFFASAKARSEDAAHGGMLAAFAQANTVTFLKTDSGTGAVALDPAGSLYVFIVNENNGARIYIPKDPVCANGVLEAGEECDDGDTVDTNFCSNICKNNIPLPFGSACGNGAIESGETCDDSNTTADDGCSATCSVEAGYTCTGAPSICSSGNPPPPPPPPPPAAAVCGNGVIESGETCDDGNAANTDGCSSTCIVETDFSCTGAPSTCQSYLEFVKALADTNTDGTVSDNEALVLTLDVADAPAQPYNTVSQFDIDGDGDVDNTDVTIILTQLDILAPTT